MLGVRKMYTKIHFVHQGKSCCDEATLQFIDMGSKWQISHESHAWLCFIPELNIKGCNAYKYTWNWIFICYWRYFNTHQKCILSSLYLCNILKSSASLIVFFYLIDLRKNHPYNPSTLTFFAKDKLINGKITYFTAQ